MDIENIFAHRMNDERYNTSYPLSPEHWKPFKVKGELDYTGCTVLSFYIHIPFCEHLCYFCEYTRMLVPSREIQRYYLNAIRHDINSFLNLYPNITLYGFDIGGGTPTSLCDECFEELLNIYKEVVERVSLTDDFEPSIEATFQTLSDYKVRLISKAGIKRVSFGLQSSVKSVQNNNGRVNPTLSMMDDVIQMIHTNGIEKINIDLMYGLKNQTLEDIETDVACIKQFAPEQITLYELRTNMLCYKENSSKEELFRCYNQFFEGLTKLEYNARFGQNTFSKDLNDQGLSSYLRHRMLEFIPYKGFGLSAQSMSPTGISYNLGKSVHQLKYFIQQAKSYPSVDTYMLPSQEMLSKYMAISAYYGQMSIAVANRILEMDFMAVFKSEVVYCIRQGLIEINGDKLTITRKGFEYYGAVFSLFFDTIKCGTL